jgi:hypothetical protein
MNVKGKNWMNICSSDKNSKHDSCFTQTNPFKNTVDLSLVLFLSSLISLLLELSIFFLTFSK